MNFDEFDRELRKNVAPATTVTRSQMWSFADFCALPVQDKDADRRDRQRAIADSEKHGHLIDALRSGPNWRKLPRDPSIKASDYALPSFESLL